MHSLRIALSAHLAMINERKEDNVAGREPNNVGDKERDEVDVKEKNRISSLLGVDVKDALDCKMQDISNTTPLDEYTITPTSSYA